MPHCGYCDSDVEAVYDQLEKLHAEARRSKRIFVLGGDWNAEVQATEDDPFVGRFTIRVGNARGDWLQRWAKSERLVLTNTIFQKRWGHLWTPRAQAKVTYNGFQNEGPKKPVVTEAVLQFLVLSRHPKTL